MPNYFYTLDKIGKIIHQALESKQTFASMTVTVNVLDMKSYSTCKGFIMIGFKLYLCCAKYNEVINNREGNSNSQSC